MMENIPTTGKLEFRLDSKQWRYICACLGFTSEQLTWEMGFFSRRIDAVLAKGKITGPAAACLIYICKHNGYSLASLLKEGEMLLSLSEFAAECRVSGTTVRRWIKRGVVTPTAKEPNILIHSDEVVNYLTRKFSV